MLGKASLRHRSPPACTFVHQPQTECGRHDRWVVVPGSASETHGQKVLPWPTKTVRGDGEGRPQPGKIWRRLDQGKLNRWRCGRPRRLMSGPWGAGEALYWRGEVELSNGSVGSAKGQAELASPWEGSTGSHGTLRRWKWIEQRKLQQRILHILFSKERCVHLLLSGHLGNTVLNIHTTERHCVIQTIGTL